MSEENSNKSPKFWITLLAIVIFLPLFLLIMYAAGQHSGEEFSPDDFTRRTFAYNKTPLLNWVVSKKVYSDKTRFIEKELIADGYIIPIRNKQKVWHLTADSGSTSLISHECDARFLTDYLDLRDEEGDFYWVEWTRDYPKSAKIFWPLVVDFARHEMYLRIPDLMQSAMDIDSDKPSAFKKQFETMAAKLYYEMGLLDLELDRELRAGKRLKRSVELNPDAKVKQTYDECLELLGDEAELVTNPEIPELIDISTMSLNDDSETEEDEGDADGDTNSKEAEKADEKDKKESEQSEDDE